MSAHVLLNLLNKLGKRDKMWGLLSILSLFLNKFSKFNNTRAWMLDSIYHMTLRILWNLISAIKNVIILSLCTQRCYGRLNFSRKSVKHLWFINFIAWHYITPRRDVMIFWFIVKRITWYVRLYFRYNYIDICRIDQWNLLCVRLSCSSPVQEKADTATYRPRSTTVLPLQRSQRW